MTKEQVLMMMAHASREERKQGFTGWVQAPAECAELCESLVDGGLAEESDKHAGWYRPTKAGHELIAANVQTVQ